MEVNKELIIKVAKNSRISLTEEEIKEFVPQFKDILNNFSDISGVKTDNVKSSFQPIEVRNSLREDLEKECVPVDKILKNTKHKKGDYFLGPRAL